MTTFDPESFVTELMKSLQSLDFGTWFELSLDRALKDMNEDSEEHTFRSTVITFVQLVYKHLPNSLTLNSAHAWDLANQMLDLAYPCENSTGSTAAYLDYTLGHICTDEHLSSILNCGLKQYLQDQHIQSMLSEQLAELSFSKRMAIARFVQPQYEQLGITIPTHHLAHSLESVLMQLFETK